MRRHRWLLTPLVLVTLAAAACTRPIPPTLPRPGLGSSPMNVVLFVIDDVRFDSLGAVGNPAIRTPRLDELANDGVLFQQAFVTTSVCWASRASILTGQYLSRHGVTSPRGRSADGPDAPPSSALAPEQWARSFPGVLQQAGYWTAFTGKWNLGGMPEGYWDVARVFEGQHWYTMPDGSRVHDTARNQANAIEFLRTRPPDRPFLLDVSFFAAHAVDQSEEQYFPQDWSAPLYEGVRIPPPLHPPDEYLGALPSFLSAPANEGRVRYHWRFDGTDARYQDYMTRYFRLITEVDDAIGRILDELDAQGVADNTLVVFIGDNGYFQADRGLADKWYPYEESIRVPLVVRDPRVPEAGRGQRRDEMALNIDVAPTIVSALGLGVPPTMQGEDLAPLYLDGGAVAWRDEFFYEMHQITSRDRIPASQAIVRRDWKYASWPDWDHEQLFDLSSDPDEAHNLVDEPAYASRRDDMRQRLESWIQRVK